MLLQDQQLKILFRSFMVFDNEFYYINLNLSKMPLKVLLYSKYRDIIASPKDNLEPKYLLQTE